MTQLAFLSPGHANTEAVVPIQARLLSRATDPVTSKRGATSVVRSRRLKTQCDEVEALVRDYPGRTAAELHQLSGREGGFRFIISKRLPILERRNKVTCRRNVQNQPTLVKTCMVTGHLAAAWWPREAPDAL